MESSPRHAGALTRRGALALGAAAGAAALAHGAAAPLGAIAAPRRRAFDFAPEAFGRRGVSGALRVAGGFVLVGLRDPLGAGAHLDVRTRREGGGWGPWTRLGAHVTHAPDGSGRPRASDPVWTGRAHELQLRASRHPRRPVRIEVVSVSPAAHAIAGARAAHAAARTAQLSAGPPIVPRADWGGDRVIPRARPSYGAVEVAFVHHTDGGNAYGPDDSAAIVLAIAKYHRDTKGWNDVGYNFLVDRYGRIFEGRAGGTDLPVIGAHAQGYNARSTGVAILGSFTGEPATEQALDAVARLLGWKLPIHGAPVLGTQVVVSAGGATNRYRYGTRVALQRINGHRDGDSTACPGNRLYAQLPDLRARAAKLAVTPAVVSARVGLAAPRSAGYGEVAAFSGTVLSVEGAPQPGIPVSVQKQGPGGNWSTIARATTAADGSFRTTAPWKRAGQVRALALKTPSAPLTVGLLPKLEARIDQAQLVAGGRLVVRGTVRPAERVTVIIERRSAGRWSRVAAPATPAARGSFTLRRRIMRPGTYRVIARAAHAGNAVRTAPLLVTVTAPAPGSRIVGGARLP
jgi:hypothetical protein